MVGLRLRAAMIVLVAASSLAAQETQTAASDPDSSSSPARVEREISPKKLFPNLASDQKRIWTAPLHLRRDRNWVPAAVIVGTTAALIALDPPVGRHFRDTDTFDGFGQALDGSVTEAATVAVPAIFYVGGLLSKDGKMRDTGLLAAEALGNALIVSTVIKSVSSRARPIDLPPNDSLSDTFFASEASTLSVRGGFPSGHTIAAFAVATVIAHRYRGRRWVPFVAYGLATAIGFSRITQSAHFPADVFLGGALGYSISRFAVLRY